MVDKMISAFEPETAEVDIFRCSAEGWQRSTAEACVGCEYVPWVALPRAVRPEKFTVQPDGAAAARAVACLRLAKPC
jgi:hypothetical protein